MPPPAKGPIAQNQGKAADKTSGYLGQDGWGAGCQIRPLTGAAMSSSAHVEGAIFS